ncbi:MBL fold metallo-hydrolase [Paenibacillus sambharensis]|uniref:MBL fold metallo-hydrolase n=1 Tax=Paenibacillus sambharensis TaxID=1803190 RepID=A0A2W1L579_9BACL|nr:MBL fold metallo-hydrolase [Paenibacillus sambharensis]PZD94083.1 MBL fold metallo-hydrolase [Paenibacillus sambharensis]
MSGNGLAVHLCDNGWIRVKVPLPFSLRYVNSYLLPEAEGWTLIDPGLHTPEAAALWTEVLSGLSITAGQIKRIVLTHQHPDHYGLAGWFQERSGAPACMSLPAHRYALRLWGEDRSFDQELTEQFRQHGMPETLLEQIASHLAGFVERVSPQPEVTYIEEGMSMQFGGRSWELLHTPGHASGHICFYDRTGLEMICGDAVLPGITPNISLVPGEHPDPLQQFLDSLNRLSRFDVVMAYPGHREPFANFRGRTQDLITHHEQRLHHIEGLLQEPVTGYQLCERLFGARTMGSAHNLRFAMSETLAHLEHLVHKGRAAKVKAGYGLFKYVSAVV